MTNAPAKVEPGDIGADDMFYPSGMPCCTLGHWAVWASPNGQPTGEDPGDAFNAAVRLGEPMACSLLLGSGRLPGNYESPADIVADANDGRTPSERAEMWNAAVDVAEGKG